jgi:hypothetical protein
MDYIDCSECHRTYNIESCLRCQRGHVLCTPCLNTPSAFLPTPKGKCPLCRSNLRLASDNTTVFDEVKKSAYKKTWKFTFWWWLYLFKNPDLLLSILCLPISLFILLQVSKNTTLISIIVEWIVGSLIASIAPILFLVFIQRKRSNLGPIDSWRTSFSNLKPLGLTVGIVAIVLAIRILVGK